jgi:hypothetical protein
MVGLKEGGNIQWPLFPRKVLRVISWGWLQKRRKRKKSEKYKDEKEYFVNLLLDPEVTHSKEGLIEGWLSKELYPVEGKIKDVILFGDVKGTLIKKS